MIHGTAHAYIEKKCRCDECRIASNLRASKNRRRIAYGLPTKFVDATPAKEYLQFLIVSGWGIRKISELTGLHRTTVRQLAYGRSPAEQKHSRLGRPAQISRILRKNSDLILGLRFSLEDSSPCNSVDAKGFKRRAEALAVMGYSFSWQATQLGVSPQNFFTMMRQDKVFAKNMLKMDSMFRDYAFTKRVATNLREQQSITRTIRYAKKHGFVSAMAWNDIDTDARIAEVDVDKTLVDSVKVDLFIEGAKVKLTKFERDEAFKRMTRSGLSASRAGMRLNWSGSTISEKTKELA
jgi:hypothetical protein